MLIKSISLRKEKDECSLPLSEVVWLLLLLHLIRIILFEKGEQLIRYFKNALVHLTDRFRWLLFALVCFCFILLDILYNLSISSNFFILPSCDYLPTLLAVIEFRFALVDENVDFALKFCCRLFKTLNIFDRSIKDRLVVVSSIDDCFCFLIVRIE